MLEIDPDKEIDSLDLVEAVMGLEEAFDTSIPDNDAKKIRRVQNAVKLVDRLKAEQNSKSR